MGHPLDHTALQGCSRRLRERQHVLSRRRHLFEQAANDPLGFELLFEPLCSRGVPADFPFLPLGGFGFETLLGDADLLFADRQDRRLLIPFGPKLILLATDVVLELQTFELNLLTFDFEFVAQSAVVLRDRRAAGFDATSNHFGIDGWQEFRPGFFHCQSSFQRESVGAFHLAAHHLEPLPAGFELFQFQRSFLGLLLDRGELGRALLFEFCSFAGEPALLQSDFVRAICQQASQRFGLASQ